MSERIGIVTGGGDCPGLNAVIRAAAKAAAKRGWETIGFLGGYEGILEPQRYVQLEFCAHGTGPGDLLGRLECNSSPVAQAGICLSGSPRWAGGRPPGT